MVLSQTISKHGCNFLDIGLVHTPEIEALSSRNNLSDNTFNLAEQPDMNRNKLHSVDIPFHYLQFSTDIVWAAQTLARKEQ